MSTYNRPAYVASALGSILAQSHRNLQVILVRDGGTDVRQIVDRFDDPRIVFIDRDVNRGLPYSFNEGLSRARGRYVCYLGDDDLFYRDHVAILVDALETHKDYGLAYTDLYKVHCRIEPDGKRTVLSKNVEISRDFDRWALLQFNHVLHVSLMHRRELLDKIGPCNEKLNVLVDWDLTRKLSFYTDFLHVNRITGEFYASTAKDADRISVRRRKNVNRYIYNLLTIMSTRPTKPWPKVFDLSIILSADGLNAELEESLRRIWSHTFYPYQIYLPLPRADLLRLKTVVPNIVGVPVAPTATADQRIKAAIDCCQGDYIAIVPSNWQIRSDDVAWIEKSLYALINNDDPTEAYELVGSEPWHRGAVFRCEQIRRAQRMCGDMDIWRSVEAAGVKLRPPEMAEWPFQMDNLVTNAQLVEKDGRWLEAARFYELIPQLYHNELWMKGRCANALYHGRRYEQAAEIVGQLNRTRPTVATLLIEARARRKMEDCKSAIRLFKQAQDILEGRELVNAG